MHKVAIQLGSFPIYWYGVLIAAGVLAGLWVASRQAPRDGIPAERVLDLGPWVVLGALVGSRLLYVLSYWREEFAGQPWWEIFNIRNGGLVFYGGFVGAALAVILYVRWKRLPLWRLADVLAPGIGLGYFFGRLGCFMYGCCYGRACDLPWAVRFPYGHETYPQAVHPTQLYEALSGLLLFALLTWVQPRKRFDGQVFALFLMAYAVIRFAVEFVRGDYPERYFGGWATPAHLLSLCLFAAGVWLLWFRASRRGA